jgi:hypothetical protein
MENRGKTKKGQLKKKKKTKILIVLAFKNYIKIGKIGQNNPKKVFLVLKE